MKRMTYFGNGFLLVGSTVDDKNDCRNGSRFWPFCKENQKNLVSRWKCYIQSRQMNTEIELGVRMNVIHFSVQHFIACSSMPTSFLSMVVIDLIFLPKKSEKPRNQNKKYRKKIKLEMYDSVLYILLTENHDEPPNCIMFPN